MTARRAAARIAGLVAALALAGCSRPAPPGEGRGDGASGASPASAGSAPDAFAAPAADAPKAYAGTYTSRAGTLYVPDGGEWTGTKWRGDDAPEGLGDGAIALSVAGSRVDGTIDGPLGPARIVGAVNDGQITGEIVRKEPADLGFTGTLVGKVEGASVDGEMRLSIASARVIRRATFSLKAR